MNPIKHGRQPTKTPLYEQLYSYIINEIRMGHLKGGDRVPSEIDLGKQFNVSRITSKKALEILEQSGVIDRTRGKGSFVRHDVTRPGSFVFPNETALDPLSDVNRGDPPPAAPKAAIGIIIPDMGESYGLTMFLTLQRYCAARGFQIVPWFSWEAQEIEETAIRELLKFGVQGLIVIPVHGEYYNAELVQLAFRRFPVVLIDRYLAGIPVATVYTNHRQAARALTDYLLDRGHRAIAFLSVPSRNTSSIEERIHGYSSALVARGIAVNPDYLVTHLAGITLADSTQDSFLSDQTLLAAFMADHPEVTAFFACEYNIAVRFLATLNSLGKRVPDDYELVCFDAPPSRFGTVPYTYVRQDEVTIAQTAIDVLFDQIDQAIQGGSTNMPNTAKPHIIDYTIVQAESTRSTVESRS